MLKEENGGGHGVAGVNEAWSVKIPDDQSIIKIGNAPQIVILFANIHFRILSF